MLDIPSDVISLDEKREELKKNPALKVAGTEPPAQDWLSRIDIDTDFIVQDKTGMAPKWMGIEWTMGGRHPSGNILLIPTKTQNNVQSWVWVCDPIDFCTKFKFMGVIETHEDKQPWKEPENEILRDS